MKIFKTLSTVAILSSAMFLVGCGGGEPGSTVTDETPAGTPSPPMEVDGQINEMGADYAREQGGQN